MICRNSLFILLLIFSSVGFGQRWILNKSWEPLGPDSMPHTSKERADAGIGPIEFIRVNQKVPGLYLAGSLSGGLFYSDNGGEQWYNAGSDDWMYSGCGWADFHPEQTETWFAYSNVAGANGKPGKIDREGGIMRTKNKGTSWQRILSFKDFGNNPYFTIYGTRFHPKNSNIMYVMSSDGIYYTEDCLSPSPRWSMISGIKGWIYDMDFIGDVMYVSNMFKGKWNIYAIDIDDYSKREKLKVVEEDIQKKRTITFEPIGNNLLLFLDYETGADALKEYFPDKPDSLAELLMNQKVNFGSGHTLAVNPHTNDEVVCGYSTGVRKYHYPEMTKVEMGRKHHVDIEFVAFDPFDENKLYMATHGGVYISSNRGELWEFKSNGLGVAEVMGMDVSVTDPNEIVIGCFHDGSTVLADWNKDGNYFWSMVNGGDALTPLIDPSSAAIVYTSNQYSGGGIYYSSDTARDVKNIHELNGQKTSGWEMTAVLHPKNPNLLFYNFMRNKGEGKNNTDVARTAEAGKRNTSEIISDFGASHNLKNYKVYGLFNSPFYPDHLFAYVLHYDVDSENKKITRHRLFRTLIAAAPAQEVLKSWVEVEVPRSSWIADVEIDPLNPNILYMAYTSGNSSPETMFGDKGLIYTLKYRNGTGVMRREIDITRNIPNEISGRFNLICLDKEKRQLLFAGRTGVYVGDSKVTRGRSRWSDIGRGLPHCKIFNLHYHQEKQILTVGTFGRGVWRYYLTTE